MSNQRFSVLPGAVFMLLGAVALILVARHPLTPDREIVLRFPRIIAAGLVIIGAITVGRDFRRAGAPSEKPPLRPLLFVSGSVVAFAVLIEATGLLPAVSASVTIAALGFRGTRWSQVLILAVLLALAIALLFVGLLNQPMKLISGF